LEIFEKISKKSKFGLSRFRDKPVGLSQLAYRIRDKPSCVRKVPYLKKAALSQN
jgi:hypothetical protein